MLTVERSGYATVQDLGRPGYAAIGISGNGAADQRAARTANLLVGNSAAAPLLEVTGSELGLVTDSPLLVAVAGAADQVMVDGHPQPAWETLVVPAGARIRVPQGAVGLRSYLAVNGEIEAERALGSVAPDPLIAVGRHLAAGDRLAVRTAYDGRDHSPAPALFRLGARPPRFGGTLEVLATPGPELDRLTRGADALGATFEVLPQSDHVGLRLAGSSLELTSSEEVLSRGVPLGAVQVPSSGDPVILMRGRLVTAGYPVVAVVTTTSLDDLGQLGPGGSVRLRLVELGEARRSLAEREAQTSALAGRVHRAFVARGWGGLLSPELARRP